MSEDSEIQRELKDSVNAWVKFQQRRSTDLALENKELKALLTRAADALDCHNLDHLQDDLIDELRKAAE